MLKCGGRGCYDWPIPWPGRGRTQPTQNLSSRARVSCPTRSCMVMKYTLNPCRMASTPRAITKCVFPHSQGAQQGAVLLAFQKAQAGQLTDLLLVN